MITLNVANNICTLESTKDGFELKSILDNCLTMHSTEKRVVGFGRGRKPRFEYVNVSTPLYTTVDGDRHVYTFPRGLYSLMERQMGGDFRGMEVIDSTTDIYGMSPHEVLETDIENVLRPHAGFSLREDQVLSVQKALFHKRGVIQIPTGGGKTEIMSAIISVLERRCPDIRILVIEPTDVLVNKTTERFNRYHLNATRYKDIRGFGRMGFNVLVAHPTSLLHDTEDDPTFLHNMSVVFWDECQHCQCDTWMELNSRLPNCEYAIGLSALAVSEDHLTESSLRVLTPDEVLIEGATGPVIVNISPGYYIERGILATPIVVQVMNDMTSLKMPTENDWHKLRKRFIEGQERTDLAAGITELFARYDRRILILVGTKNQAKSIAKALAKRGLAGRTVVSFGAGVSHRLDADTGKFIDYDGDDVLSDFDDGRFSILISTSHMDEGVDISNLDVAILASGGKKDRKIVQRVGRALRRNKTGRYAYIVDFLDKGNGVLENHARIRMDLYENTIQIPEDRIFRGQTIDGFERYFRYLEGIDELPDDGGLMEQLRVSGLVK